MSLLEKFSIDWDSRYNILSLETRVRIAEELLEPFKIRDKKVYEKEIENRPRLIDENGNKTNKLLAGVNERNGQILSMGRDEKGFYAIFQPRKNEIKKLESYLCVEDKIKKLSILSKLQHELVSYDITYEDFTAKQKEIDELFRDVFELSNTHFEKDLNFPFYCEVGALFAQGLFRYGKGELYFRDIKYDSVRKLSEFIKNSEVSEKKSVQQYVNATIKDINDDKNFYQSLKKMEKIMKYCRVKGIQISQEFQSKYDYLNK